MSGRVSQRVEPAHVHVFFHSCRLVHNSWLCFCSPLACGAHAAAPNLCPPPASTAPQTCYYAKVFEKDVPKALEILSDILQVRHGFKTSWQMGLQRGACA